MAEAWSKACDVPIVEVYRGGIFEIETDAVVSPANSFGFMDGGIDALYTRRFGEGVQETLQTLIRAIPMRELLVGMALAVRTGDSKIPWCIAAPTMRVPMILGPETVNPYLAAKAALLVAKEEDSIKTVAFPGLGTGVGRVPPEVCARQVRAAIDEVIFGINPFPASWRTAQLRHLSLYTDSEHDLQHERGRHG